MSGESLPMLMFSLSTSFAVFDKPFKMNKVISSISKGTFDVYLIHMNHFVYLWLWNKAFNVQEYYVTPFFIVKLVCVSLVIFTGSLAIGNIRKAASNYMYSKMKIDNLEKYYRKIDLTLKFEKRG